MLNIMPWIPYVLCGLTVASALGIIGFKHPVYAALSLMATFLFSAMIWLSLQAEFLAFALILIYVGAVMVLFLFVVMMINAKQATHKRWCWRYLILALALATGFHMALWPALSSIQWPEAMTSADMSVKLLGQQLFTTHVLAFEMAGLILLSAMVSAILMTHRGPQRRRSQRVDEQVAVQASERVTLVNMKSENRQP